MNSALVATFSLVARDDATGHLGVAVASKFLAVGSVVPSATAGVAAFASQALANTSYGPRALKGLAQGQAPARIVEEFRDSDEQFEQRQFGLVTASGEALSHTGSECLPWAGGITGPGFAAQGNILAGPEVLTAMVDTWKSSSEPFPERLLAALQAAEDAGGDSRGRQSAALYVVGEGMGYGGLSDRWIDLRVDDHPQPIPELKRLLGLYRLILGGPEGEPVELSRTEISWLQRHFSLPESGVWDSATEEQLRLLYGRENLEDRWLGGPRVDPGAWRHLRSVLAA